MANSKSLSLLTFNTGLFSLRFFRLNLLDSVPFAKKRLQVIPKIISEKCNDIVALQEVFYEKHKKFLVEKLKPLYPYVARKKPNLFGLDNGLVMFSKNKIIDSKFIPFKSTTFEEKLFANQGMLTVTVDNPQFGELNFLNVHLAAGGLFRHPESKLMERIRQEQIEQVLTVAEQEKDNTFIIGDFNAGPQVSIQNYKTIIQKGFIDLFNLAKKEKKFKFTWDPKNYLNLKGYSPWSPPQRIDHIFVPKQFKQFVDHIKSNVVFNEAVVHAKKFLKVTPSDHYGLSIKLVKKN
ncbi:hypothetical protein HN587_01070 [Candidatus Woesearchaeota archaeon]|nr:hypothetical protein [Candidatus Woesearchaeota archaeon]